MTVQILTGDCRTLLAALPAESVHCVVTSPPYYGLRSYLPPGHPDKLREIGSEGTLAAYLATVVAVMAEVRRVLRKDGTLWLNIGDSYAASCGSTAERNRVSSDPSWKAGTLINQPKSRKTLAAVPGLRAKQRMMVPARLALALQDDGWWIRQEIIWDKPAPMPESATDRPTTSHEQVFLLTKRASYFYDAVAVQQQPAAMTVARLAQDVPGQRGSDRAHAGGKTNGTMKAVGTPSGASLRSVWRIPPAPFRGDHFATFPPALAETCIRASTSERGCCPVCAAPLRRVLADRGADLDWQQCSDGNAAGEYHGQSTKGHAAAGVQDASAVKARILTGMRKRETIGWAPTCRHRTAAADPVPCTVLDPFAGVGTTGLAADRLRRDAVLLELNPKDVATARRRIAAEAPLLTTVVGAEPEAHPDMFPPASQEAAD